MNFDDFFRKANELDVKVKFNDGENKIQPLLSNEALFHLPFLAMTVLLLSKGKRKPISSELGQIVGECLEKTLSGFKGSSQHLEWSANLRIRTIRALTYLEMAHLVLVDKNTKIISATMLGKQVIEKATNSTSNLSVTLSYIERNFRNFCTEKQILMELR